mmetsp:Transcript_22870/g.49441  ORF Transcript_22870/g.49441 Transcript_22870/m.49441 type:complete len:189 (+) Transcript_22870:348-914(+)
MQPKRKESVPRSTSRVENGDVRPSTVTSNPCFDEDDTSKNDKDAKGTSREGALDFVNVRFDAKEDGKSENDTKKERDVTRTDKALSHSSREQRKKGKGADDKATTEDATAVTSTAAPAKAASKAAAARPNKVDNTGTLDSDRADENNDANNNKKSNTAIVAPASSSNVGNKSAADAPASSSQSHCRPS